MAKLSSTQRKRARWRAAQAALLGYRNREHVHYTQGSARWSGIRDRKSAFQGEFPSSADCSGYTTWALWNGLYLAYRKPDIVNGCGWLAGFTGTQIRHGRKVDGAARMLRGDLVFYATSGETPTHVAICVGRNRDDKPMVVSHGSEAGPLYLPFSYRRHIEIRRYVHDGI